MNVKWKEWKVIFNKIYGMYNPFHPHCGPGNKISPIPSENPVDEVCRLHDIDYYNAQVITGKWYSPYITYDWRDARFISKQTNPIYRSFFKLKRYLLENKMEDKSESTALVPYMATPLTRRRTLLNNVDKKFRLKLAQVNIRKKKVADKRKLLRRKRVPNKWRPLQRRAYPKRRYFRRKRTFKRRRIYK